MNKQEAIKKLKEKRLFFEDDYFGVMTVIELDDAQKIISQIEEPQKPAIPKFVAEWIKKYRYAHTLLKVLNSAENERIIPSTVNVWIVDNQYEFTKAWIDGYKEETDENE